jgi:hypothetical protein
VTGAGLALSQTFNGYGEQDGSTVSVGVPKYGWVTERENSGRIYQKTETLDGVTTVYVYGYDPVGRLRTVTRDGTLVEEYTYAQDSNGRRYTETNTLRG